jgi:hypothetical protein
LVWFALGQAVRVMKAGPAIVALAVGQTSNAVAANLVRVLTLPLAWIVVLQGGGLVTLLWIALAGEALGLMVSIWLMLRRTALPRGRIWGQQATVMAVMGAIGTWALVLPPDVGLAAWPVWVASAVGLMAVLWLMPETRRRFRLKRT